MREFGYWADLLVPLQDETSVTLLASKKLLTSLIKPDDQSLLIHMLDARNKVDGIFNFKCWKKD